MELKRSWEVHGQMKRMRALAKAGPEALRNYAVRYTGGQKVYEAPRWFHPRGSNSFHPFSSQRHSLREPLIASYIGGTRGLQEK